jgi:haloacetate dehalogenase
MGAEAFAEYQQAVRDPDTVRAMLEDYRAGLRIDRTHDETDQANGRRVGCPTLVLWSRHDDLEYLYGDPLQIWESWTDDLRDGHSINSGHHMAEEAPDELARSLLTFLTQCQQSRVDPGLRASRPPAAGGPSAAFSARAALRCPVSTPGF